jgi:hypothetical protein
LSMRAARYVLPMSPHEFLNPPYRCRNITAKARKTW